MDGRSKGNRAENEVCYILSSWVFPATDWSSRKVYELPFRRRTTAQMPSTLEWEMKGDIVIPAGTYFPFCVESKRVEGWTLDTAFRDSTRAWKVSKYWEQAKAQAAAMGAETWPLMFFRRNNWPWTVMAPPVVSALVGPPALLLSDGVVFRSSALRTTSVAEMAALLRNGS